MGTLRGVARGGGIGGTGGMRLAKQRRPLSAQKEENMEANYQSNTACP